jgi:hypothetical protein
MSLINKKMSFFVDFAVFFRTIDGLLRYGKVSGVATAGHLGQMPQLKL